MAVKMKIGSSFSCVSTYPCSPFRGKLSSRLVLFNGQHFDAEHLRSIKVVKSSQLIHKKLSVKGVSSNRRCILFAVSEDQQSYSEDESDDIEQERQQTSAQETTSANISYYHIGGAQGKPGFISFYGHSRRSNGEILVSSPKKEKSYLLWFVGPTILVASFVFPSLYLRRILSTIFEDSLLTDFLILFFTEGLFYCGVAIFLLMIDRLRRPVGPIATSANHGLAPLLGYRVTSVAILILSLIIPMVTMGFVWPWTGPAASATLAPYLVGIVVQFVFERYARHIKSPSWPVIPIIFQVYRLHQLNRAAQLVTALSFTVRGAEMTSHNVAINGSLSTLLNVLQFLGVICIWSLSSFIMRYFPSSATPEQ